MFKFKNCFFFRLKAKPVAFLPVHGAFVFFVWVFVTCQAPYPYIEFSQNSVAGREEPSSPSEDPPPDDEEEEDTKTDDEDKEDSRDKDDEEDEKKSPRRVPKGKEFYSQETPESGPLPEVRDLY